MSIEDLKRAKDERPFQPFRIRMTDGMENPINHPDAIAWDRGSPRVVFVVSQGENYWLEVGLITAIVRPVPAAADDGD